MSKSIIITGATGTAGSEVVRQALLDADINKVIVLSRKPLNIIHPKLTVIIHSNFIDYSGLQEIFKQADACIWCLGISQTQVNKATYINITYDYTLAAANAMLAANPLMAFVFLSGMGADSKEKSRTLFARVKGQTENALQKLAFSHFYVARPGGIMPVHSKPNESFTQKVFALLAKTMGFIMPSMTITTEQLAKAMLNLVKNGSDKVILENKALKERIEG